MGNGNAHSPQPIIPPQRQPLPQPRKRRLQRLETSIKGTAVDGSDGWNERDDFLGQLLGLFDAVRGERRVGGDLGGRGHVGVVFARGGVEGPIDAELARSGVCVSKVLLEGVVGVGSQCCRWIAWAPPLSERCEGFGGA